MATQIGFYFRYVAGCSGVEHNPEPVVLRYREYLTPGLAVIINYPARRNGNRYQGQQY